MLYFTDIYIIILAGEDVPIVKREKGEDRTLPSPVIYIKQEQIEESRTLSPLLPHTTGT